MRDKSRVGGNKMSVVDGTIADARRMSNFMLQKKFRGIGDTIERAAYEAEQTWGAPASIMLRLRHRDVSDMLLSNWLRLKAAYDAACETTERQAQHQQTLAEQAGINADNSRLYAAGAVLAGPKDEAVAPTPQEPGRGGA